jgi:uncharacterized phage-associated protein
VRIDCFTRSLHWAISQRYGGVLDIQAEEYSRPLRLKPNVRRILESILFLIEEGVGKGAPLTQYQIVKSLFLADLHHLQNYGRPITFDNYAALEFGPVPETAYDILKPSSRPIPGEEENWPLWEREPAGGKAFRYVRPKRSANKRVLSKSDQLALGEAMETAIKLPFGRIVDITHKHPAYEKAWSSRGTKMSMRMDYKLLLPDDDSELLEEIVHASKFM